MTDSHTPDGSTAGSALATDGGTTELPLADLVALPDLHHPVVSPDGERVAFYYDDTGRIELYVQDLATGERRQVSDGNVPREAHPLAWRPDGEAIYFHEGDGGDEQTDVHEMSLDGERSAVVENEGQNVLEDVDPGGRYLLYTSTAGEQKNLYRYDRDAGASEQLTDYDRPVWTAIYGPDAGRVAYVANETADRENRDVYVADADGSNPRNLDIGETGAEVWPFDWAGDRLLVGDNTPDLGRVGVYDLDADEATWYGAGDHEERPVAFAPDGGVLATRSRDCAEVPVHYRAPDDGEEFDLPDGVAAPAGHGTRGTFTADGRAVLTHGTDDAREDLLAYDLATGEREALVPADYGAFDPDGFVAADHVTYDSHDGLAIDGLLWDSGQRPSPALVMVHGGPHSRTVRRFDPFVQYLVARGYTIFAPNYRGSTGRGRAFKNMIHGDWGGDEQRDVRAAGRWLKARDWVDADRVGVFGGSYGGYSTYWQLTNYPEEWAAGVAIVGMTDLERLYEESMPHFKATLEEHLGDPDEYGDRYEQRSPVTHVENMTSPLCMVQGVNDPRVPVSQARIFRDALDDLGWRDATEDPAAGTDAPGEYEYHELGEEGHVSSDTDQRVRQYRILADFIERRL